MNRTPTKVELLPWDPNNDAQFIQMQKQQVGLGWFQPITAEWKTQHLKGIRTLFWIVIADGQENQEALVEKHLARFPAEREPIIDTAAMVGHMARTASQRQFTPVGHVGLVQISASQAGDLALPLSTFRLVSLYVSWALQGSGVGASAVKELEQIAASPPFNATCMALETITKDFQLQEAYLKTMYDNKRLERPLQTNVEWYSRRGFEVVEGSEYTIKSESAVMANVLPNVSLVQMQKKLD